MRIKQSAALFLVTALLLTLTIPGSFRGNSSSQEKTVMAVDQKKREASKHTPRNAAEKKKAAAPKKAAPKGPEIKLSVPEKKLLERLVQAEAKGEPYKGKVAVAEVVINRVQSGQFPDTVKEVIYQKKQFQPVSNGQINKPAGQDAKKAVNEALYSNSKITTALYFFNPDATNDGFMHSRPVEKRIGNHLFTS
ncbi:cell wall hydrolase [Peribacillus kribbensis]|uniref:cell wall hydrolase n=1 Tax=Peribacillus kribbensis TaxID=356658 RepID=UPI0003FF46F0|nr:cell wall hydrolase [Peribacillus kribbensis]